MYTCMRLTTSDGRFAMANFFPTFSIFCKHPSKFTCHPIFSVPERKNRCRKSGVVCRKSESDTCKQPNINEKEGKNRCRKSAVGCRKQHTWVHTLTFYCKVKIAAWRIRTHAGSRVYGNGALMGLFHQKD